MTRICGKFNIQGRAILLFSQLNDATKRRTAAHFSFFVLFLTFTLIPICSDAYWQAGKLAEAETYADRGLQLAQEGNLAAAEIELRQASKLAPNNAEILASFGTVLAMQKKLEESTTVFSQALKLAPGDITIRRYLAANLWQLRRFPQAKANLEILLKQKPDDQQARLLLGMVSENTRDYATAARMLSSVPEQVKQQPESIAALARSYYHLGDTQKARVSLFQLSIHPAGTQAVLLGVQIADQMHDYETAEKMLRPIQSQFTDRAEFSYRLGLVQYHAGRFDACQRTLLDAIDAGHASGQVYNLLGWSYYELHQPKEAVEALNRAIELAPRDEANYLDLANILVAGNSLPSALGVARKATTALPQSAKLFALRGSIEAKVGQFSDAVNSYTQAVQLDSSRPSSITGLAEAQFSADMIKDATATFESAIRRFPNDAHIRLSYGAALLKQAQTGDSQSQQRAEEMFRGALALDPRSATAHYELGKLALEKGSVHEAVEHLKKAVELNHTSSEAHFALSRAYRRAGRSQDAARELKWYEKLKNAPTEGSPLLDGPTAQDRF
jgi:tetratricopeptide (TPR) repeat protein